MSQTSTCQQGKELGLLAKFLFDKAVVFWYTAIGIEIFVSLFAIITTVTRLPEKFNISVAAVGFSLLAVAYCLKISFYGAYDTAETMRRQSVLTLALNWPISKVQFSAWRCLAGKNIIKKVDAFQPTHPYYSTKEKEPKLRLLEMTAESAFWTRHLYFYLKRYIRIIFIIALAFVVLVPTLASTDFLSHDFASKIVYIIYLFAPLILTLDVLGWAIKLGRLENAMQQIENDLENLAHEPLLDERKVLRLVSEYNCQVAAGFPVPSWFFNFYHDRIDALWVRN